MSRRPEYVDDLGDKWHFHKKTSSWVSAYSGAVVHHEQFKMDHPDVELRSGMYSPRSGSSYRQWNDQGE
jgi:hypothetical protein